jgi:hypothetical protein
MKTKNALCGLMSGLLMKTILKPIRPFNMTVNLRILSLLVLGSLSGLTGKASAAMSFNIDFGSVDAAPASTFGASAAQPGVWNRMTSGALLPLLDLSGAATSAQIAVSGGNFGGNYTLLGGDLGLLMNDNFYSDPGNSWTMTISGLANGNYDFYYYAPTHPVVDTGAFTINGTAAPNLTGSTSGSGTVQGTDWQKLVGVAVTGGTLTTTWGSGGGRYTGLSGIQIVAAAPVPEPSTFIAGALLALPFGLQGFRWLRNRKQVA